MENSSYKTCTKENQSDQRLKSERSEPKHQKSTKILPNKEPEKFTTASENPSEKERIRQSEKKNPSDLSDSSFKTKRKHRSFQIEKHIS